MRNRWDLGDIILPATIKSVICRTIMLSGWKGVAITVASLSLHLIWLLGYFRVLVEELVGKLEQWETPHKKSQRATVILGYTLSSTVTEPLKGMSEYYRRTFNKCVHHLLLKVPKCFCVDKLPCCGRRT